jgi:hypothetical protein
MPEPLPANVRVNIVVRDDVCVLINAVVWHFDNTRRLDRSLGDVCIHVSDASMIAAVHDSGLPLHRRTWGRARAWDLGSP